MVFMLLGICSLTWMAWLAATLLEKRARGDKGGISIFPAIPFFPLAAWIAGLGLDLIRPGAGFFIVGGFHVVLIPVFLVSSAVSIFRIRKGKISSGK